jgi:hypothetical protein
MSVLRTASRDSLIRKEVKLQRAIHILIIFVFPTERKCTLESCIQSHCVNITHTKSVGLDILNITLCFKENRFITSFE